MKTYYAESNGFLNEDYCDLWRFPSKKGRDAWVDDQESCGAMLPPYWRSVLTAEDAAKRHPDQFRGRKWSKLMKPGK